MSADIAITRMLIIPSNLSTGKVFSLACNWRTRL